MATERGAGAVRDGGATKAKAGLGLWERPSQGLSVGEFWADQMRVFLAHFRDERVAIGDVTLGREERILEALSTWGKRGG